MAVEMKATMTREATALLQELEQAAQIPLKQCGDLEKIADKIKQFVADRLETMLQLGHADQQHLVPALEARSQWLEEARLAFRICWTAQISPEKYFKNPGDLKALTPDEQVRFSLIQRYEANDALSVGEQEQVDKIRGQEDSDQISLAYHEHSPVSKALRQLTRAIDMLKAKMQENAPKALPVMPHVKTPVTSGGGLCSGCVLL